VRRSCHVSTVVNEKPRRATLSKGAAPGHHSSPPVLAAQLPSRLNSLYKHAVRTTGLVPDVDASVSDRATTTCGVSDVLSASPDQDRVQLSHAFLPRRSNSHPRRTPWSCLLLSMSFLSQLLGRGRDAATQVNHYSELKQLLRYNAPAPCACALISPHHHQARVLPKAGHLRLYHEWNAAITGPAERRTLRDRPARLMHLPCERWERDWIRLSCQPHLTDGLVPAWPPQAPNQLFASHSTPSTTWGVSISPH